LRLNLAHFGGFDEPTGEPWEIATGNLMARFPNVFADLSYLSESLPSASPPRRAGVAEQIRAFLARFEVADRRLVYGSDWIMLGREADHQRYFESVKTLLGRAGVTPAQWANMSRANALRLYGLRAGEPGRLRLEAWYRKMGLDQNALAQFG
jgi:predicted TIM-barrel fold metal-dependent hydrolase